MLSSLQRRTMVLHRMLRPRGLELGRHNSRLDSSDARGQKSIFVNKKGKKNTSDSQIAHLIDKLRSSNRNSPGKFSGSSGNQRLRNVLRQAKPADAKSSVKGIDEFISEVKQSNMLEKDVLAAVVSERNEKKSKILYVEDTPQTDQKFSGTPKPTDKKSISGPVDSQAGTGTRLRDFLYAGKVSPRKLRKLLPEGTSPSEVSEIFEKSTSSSPSLISDRGSMEEAARSPNAEGSKSAKVSITDAEVNNAPDPHSSLNDKAISARGNRYDAVREPSVELSSLRNLKRSKLNVPDKSETSRSNEVVSDFFTFNSLATRVAEFKDLRAEGKQSKNVIDDLIAAQAEEAKGVQDVVSHSSSESNMEGQGGAGSSNPTMSQYFQDFKSDDEVLLGQEIRKIMTKTTPVKRRRFAKGPKIFGPSRLGIFDGSLIVCGSEKKEFISSHEKDLHQFLQNLEASSEPQNSFEAQMCVSNKLWQLPVDNEVAKHQEEDVGFEEHVFLDYLLDEFPPVPAIQQFMELVINGLQQNPHLSVQQKKERVSWFKEYFSQFLDDDFQLAVDRAAGV